jgi:hypothetical protein
MTILWCIDIVIDCTNWEVCCYYYWFKKNKEVVVVREERKPETRTRIAERWERWCEERENKY